jgi:hypothetical protein
MALPSAPSSLRLARRIDVQHNARHFGPICTLGVGVEEPKISRKMLPVISREDVSVWSLVGDRRIGGSPGHDQSSPRPTVEAGAIRRECPKRLSSLIDLI